MAAKKTPAKSAKAAAAVAEPAAQRSAPVRTLVGLDDILGQDRAIGLLRAALDSGRIHHAWIFSGPPGIGKFTAAMAFAAMLLDPTVAPDLSGRLAPDPESTTRRLIREGTHPDLHIVTKEMARFSDEQSVRDGKQRVIPISVVRQFLIDPASKTSAMGGAAGGKSSARASKVFIVDEAELMRNDAQDALLKTLEEPPPGSVIILITSGEERLSPTVRSRCQRVSFVPLDEPTMRKWLDRRLTRPVLMAEEDEASAEVTPAQRDWLMRFSCGSPGWADAAIENGLYGWHEALTPLLEELDRGRFPVMMGSVMAKLVDERAAAWVKRNPDASKEAANHLWSRRLFALLAEYQRRALREGVGSGRDVSARLRAIDVLSEAERQIAMNVNATQVMENLAAQMAV